MEIDEKLVSAMEKAGWRWAGMKADAVFFDRPSVGKDGSPTIDWREFDSWNGVRRLLAGKGE